MPTASLEAGVCVCVCLCVELCSGLCHSSSSCQPSMIDKYDWLWAEPVNSQMDILGHKKDNLREEEEEEEGGSWGQVSCPRLPAITL